MGYERFWSGLALAPICPLHSHFLLCNRSPGAKLTPRAGMFFRAPSRKWEVGKIQQFCPSQHSPGMRVKLVGSCMRPPEETGPLPVLFSTVPLALLTALGLTLAETGAR